MRVVPVANDRVWRTSKPADSLARLS